MRQLLSIIAVVFPLISWGQGDRFVLFSRTGDTLITRTSCFCETKDTLTTYFNILDNQAGSLHLISVFTVKEPNKNSIPCADFKLVQRDTIFKYGFFHEGESGVIPKRFKIKSKIIQVDTATVDTGKVFFRQISHKFKIKHKTFYSATVWDISNNKRDPISQPKVHKIYGSTKLKKYHFVVIIKNSEINQQTRRIGNTYTHTRIIN